MHKERHEWHAPSLGRPMGLIWYGHWGRPVLAFPTSKGHAIAPTGHTASHSVQ